MPDLQINPVEASRWWQQNSVAGVLLNRLMLLFIFGPIGLVFMKKYTASFVVFAFMVPYGLFLRHLAIRAVRLYVSAHPETVAEFQDQGVISA